MNQVGILKYFREKFNHRNSTPSNILDSYEGSEEPFISVGRAYIVATALFFFLMSTVDDMPSRNKFLPQTKCFDDISGRFIDEFLLQKHNNANAMNEGDDFVTHYRFKQNIKKLKTKIK